MSSTSSAVASNEELERDDRVTHSNGWLIPASCLTMLTMALVADSEVWSDPRIPIVGPRNVAGSHVDEEVRRISLIQPDHPFKILQHKTKPAERIISEQVSREGLSGKQARGAGKRTWPRTERRRLRLATVSRPQSTNTYDKQIRQYHRRSSCDKSSTTPDYAQELGSKESSPRNKKRNPR
ncbi:hypothetical protein DOTSEDRAFT_34087 [Dothistroma septosporum NZE10]|uniref:Uncharacterized protein n=1 Tax=Dothistroma septosporum (strain NZE10 / CBS 128990) TaxID=675120 RepID=N1PQA9_DOTSN|nr:hypothetical protein DOTSEDRAFT_34087 [Dothistroma septosporum NZE10]